MVARTLEARLSARLLALAVVVLTSVGITAALVSGRALQADDEARARDEAAGARDALAVELAEGDSREEGARESDPLPPVGEGMAVTVWFDDGARYTGGPADLPRLAPGTCKTVDDASGSPWRACAAEGEGPSIVAALPIAGHRAAAAAVWRAMAVLVAATLLLLWWAIRRALRTPLAELTSLVQWTSRIRAHEGAQGRGPPERAHERDRPPDDGVRRPRGTCSKASRANVPIALTLPTSCELR